MASPSTLSTKISVFSPVVGEASPNLTAAKSTNLPLGLTPPLAEVRVDKLIVYECVLSSPRAAKPTP